MNIRYPIYEGVYRILTHVRITLNLQSHENSDIFFPGSGHAGRMARHTPYQTG